MTALKTSFRIRKEITWTSKKWLKSNKRIFKKERICHLYTRKKSSQNLERPVPKPTDQARFDCVKLFDINPELSTAEFSEKEITDSLKVMKPIKASDLNVLILKVWKLEKT